MRQVFEVAREVLFPTRRRSRLSVEQWAHRLGVSGRLVYAWCEDGPRSLPAWAVGPITRESGDTLLIEHLCTEAGGSFLPHPAVRAVPEDLCQSIREFGDLVSTVGDAYADGRITAAERDRIHKEAEEAIQAIVNFLAQVDASVETRPRDARAVSLAAAHGPREFREPREARGETARDRTRGASQRVVPLREAR